MLIMFLMMMMMVMMVAENATMQRAAMMSACGDVWIVDAI